MRGVRPDPRRRWEGRCRGTGVALRRGPGVPLAPGVVPFVTPRVAGDPLPPHIPVMTRRIGWKLSLGVFVVFTLLGLSKFLHFWLDDLARQHPGTAGVRLVEELTGAFGGALVFLALVPLVRRAPLTRGRWAGRLPLYLVAAILLGAFATSFMWATRSIIAPLVGLGPYDYGIMGFRYPMELALQLPNIALAVLGLHGWEWYRARREQELRAAQLEAELGRVRLERLEAQLQPHFLFNTLNGISSLMYRDPAEADRMLGKLSDLLRLTFQRSPEPEVPLSAELEWLGWYLDLMQIRFGDRLTIQREIAPAALACRVPRLVLQPLVENALKHGAAQRAGPATVLITAQVSNGRLELSVTDDGPGLPAAADLESGGVGLSNTRERLATLYGDAGRVRMENRPEGGLRVTLELPSRAVPASAPA